MSLVIVPQPPPPGLYVTLGPDWMITWSLEIITKTIAYPGKLLWVDAANAFNAYIVAIAARSAAKDPTLVLKSYLVARPFTAYQLESMISEKMLPAAQRFGALVSVIADPLRLFSEAEGRDTQIQQCYGRFLRALRAMAAETAVLVLSPDHPSRYREPLLTAASRLTKLHFIDQKPTLSFV